jgi:Homeodomain-like domain
VAGRYSNRHDLLEQLRKVAAVLSDGGQGNDAGAGVASQSVVRSRRLRDRFFLDDLQAMIDLYRSGATATAVAEKFGVSLRSIKRLLRQYGVRRERRR